MSGPRGHDALLPTRIGAGLRVLDRDDYQASDRALVDPERSLVDVGIL